MIGSRIARAWETLRREGVRSFWFKLVDVLGYRRLFLLRRSLDEPLSHVNCQLPIRMEWLRPEGFGDYHAMRPATDPEELARRLESDQRCLLARHNDRLVGAMWVVSRSAPIAYLECELPMSNTVVYLCEAYTDPKFRGQGVAPALSDEVLRRCREEGSQLAIRATLPENRAALRAHAKNGFEVYALMSRLRLGPWRRHWTKELSGRSLA
jgi:GNAT superfamily N-acetyltransferase